MDGILSEATQEVIKYILDPTLISPGFAIFWETTRLTFIIVSLLLLGLIIFLLSVNEYLEQRFIENYSELHGLKPRFRVKVDKKWQEVIAHSKSEDESERRLSVIDADDISNDVLSKMGYVGDNIYDKVTRLNKDIIPNIEEIKEICQKKKEILHNPNKNLSGEETKKIVSVYEEMLKDLQVI